MTGIRLSRVLRIISILLLPLLLYLYLELDDMNSILMIAPERMNKGLDYNYTVGLSDNKVPVFTYSLESLFPRQIAAVVVKDTIPIPEEPVPDVRIPDLKFIGMIETDERVIYSFKYVGLNKMLLFEEGVETDGLTLLSIEIPKNEAFNDSGEKTVEGINEYRVFTFVKEGITFHVEKK